MTSQRIGILMGGSAAEREVSLQNGRAVASALEGAGYDVVRIELGGRRDPAEQIRRAAIDTAFVALQGGLGENGCIQGVLEILGIPYTGSGLLETALAKDKLKSKELFRLHNVPTPAYYVYCGPPNQVAIREAHAAFGFPAMVKPRHPGAGPSLVRDDEGLASAVCGALTLDQQVLVERYIHGTEVVVGILNRRVLGLLEKGGAPDDSGKREQGTTGRLSEALYRNVLHLAERAADALGLSGAVQVTLLLTQDQNEYVLDANATPVVTPGSILSRIAEAAGYGFTELCEATLASAKLHLPQPRVSSRAAVVPLAKAEERTLRVLAG